MNIILASIESNLALTANSLSMAAAIAGMGLLSLLVAMAILFYGQSKKLRATLLSAMITIILITTVALIYCTFYRNSQDLFSAKNWPCKQREETI